MSNKKNFIIFDGDNFDDWEHSLTNHLKSKGLYRVLANAKPEGKDANEVSTWIEKDEQVQGKIGERVAIKFQNITRNKGSAKEMFEAVRKIHIGNKTNTMAQVRNLFQTATCQYRDDVRDFISQLENHQRQLADTETKIGDTELILKIMSSLPKS